LIVHPKLNNDRAIRIVEAAREEFAARGYDGARVERIARRAGTNKQLLFYYYHSKRGLFETVLAKAATELEAHVAATAVGHGPPLERLRHALQAQFDYLVKHPTYAALLAQAGRSEARPLSPALKRLVVLVAEGQGRGHVRDDVDPHIAAAQALVLMLAYLALEPLVATSAVALGADEPGLAARWKDAAVRLVVEGLAAR
jgi:AcrR family transcriptional regulator